MKDSPGRIVLTGFMGAGKTVVAAALASRLACMVIDLDHFIEAREGRNISAIIDEEGEERFREHETRALREALAGNDATARVIALGGGTWTLERNRALLMEQECLVVWLDAPFELCWRRLEGGRELRPLARDREQARRLFEARQAVYNLAGMRIRVDEAASPELLAAKILARLFGESST